jgi:threonyl-tRNA synthetase
MADAVFVLLDTLQSAHIMAMAVQKLYPDAQVTIGPWIEKGFYYDFDMKEPLTDKDLKRIKKEMVILEFHLPIKCQCTFTGIY